MKKGTGTKGMTPKTFGRFCTVQKERIKNRLAREGFRARLGAKRDRNLDLQRLMALDDCNDLMRCDEADFEYRRGEGFARVGA